MKDKEIKNNLSFVVWVVKIDQGR